ncbi:toxin YhaV, partial [Pseudomonas aeruginosa]|nr:toxin YhaV [Pseudomonas aeruginosa]
MQRHGWTLLFHEGVIEQLRKLHAAAERAEQNDPQGFESNANVKLFRALSQLIMD